MQCNVLCTYLCAISLGPPSNDVYYLVLISLFNLKRSDKMIFMGSSILEILLNYLFLSILKYNVNKFP